MADKMAKKGENTQQAAPEAEVNQAANPVDEIMAKKAAADQRRQEIQQEIDSLTAELNEANQAQVNAGNSADFQTAYEKAHALNALISRKKAEYESVKVDITRDSIINSWNAFAANYADEIKASLDAYQQEKRKLYEMLIAIAEKRNEILKVRSALVNELYHITHDSLSSDFALADPVKAAEYDEAAGKFFNDTIKAGDYLQYVLYAITVANRAADLDDPGNKTIGDQNQRVIGI